MKVWMASRRRLRRNACMGKKRHATREFALLALRLSRQTGLYHGSMNVYHCCHCCQWHVGHLTARTARRVHGSYNKREFDK
jgi:hypothetical protein